ncbi:Alpha-ketoglutarate-dependent taurine dioxygenase [Nymphon striatum]|nr:Alpha-ketoglutarate-dependent taurine dioxygenase [Nymphon striatum]
MLHAERVSPALGAEIHGHGRKPERYAGHRAAVQDGHRAPGRPLDLVRLGQSLGTLGARHHSYVTHRDSDDVVVLTWQGDDKPDAAEWHSDMTYRAEPPFASILQGIEIPPVGGDTLWASMHSVYDTLSDGLKSELAELEVVHDMGAFPQRCVCRWWQSGDRRRHGSSRHGGASGGHHPVSGRPYLNVSESFTRWIIGMSAPESARLLTMLFDTINRPEHHVRLRWQPNTIAIWDNRGTQHYAVVDYLPHRRVMHRVAVATDRRAPKP